MWFVEAFGLYHFEMILFWVIVLIEAIVFWFREKEWAARSAAFQTLRAPLYTCALGLLTYAAILDWLPFEYWAGLPYYESPESQERPNVLARVYLRIARMVPWAGLCLVMLRYLHRRISIRRRDPRYISGLVQREFTASVIRTGARCVVVSTMIILTVVTPWWVGVTATIFGSLLAGLFSINIAGAQATNPAPKPSVAAKPLPITETNPAADPVRTQGQVSTAIATIPSEYQLRVDLVTPTELEGENGRRLVYCIGMTHPYLGMTAAVWVPKEIAVFLNREFVLTVSRPWLRYDSDLKLVEFRAVDGDMIVTPSYKPARSSFSGKAEQELR